MNRGLRMVCEGNIVREYYKLAIALYRWRWQVELAFKRLKSLQGLDDMTVKHPKLCEVYLLCHVLVSLFTEKLNAQAERFFPSDCIAAAIALATLAVSLPQPKTSPRPVAA